MDIVMYRLLYSKQLSDISRRRYCAYMEDNLLIIIKGFLRKENRTGIRELLSDQKEQELKQQLRDLRKALEETAE